MSERCNMKNLCEIRKQKGMSQVALSTKLGVAQETVSAYENGKAYPSVDTLLSMCEIFNVSSDYLLDRTNIQLTIQDFCDKNLSPEELELVDKFRKLSYPKQNRALGLIIGMSE